MFSSVISSWLLISRASSIVCWPSRTSMPAFCSSNSIGGSTTSTPSGMWPTPSSSRIALISRAASRNSVRIGADGAAHAGHAGAAVVRLQPRRIQLVVLRGGAEVPDVRIAVAGKQGVAQQLVARPLADDGARGVANVVLVERQQSAESRGRERLARARETVVVQPAEIDAFLEVDLRVAGRLQRPVPAGDTDRRSMSPAVRPSARRASTCRPFLTGTALTARFDRLARRLALVLSPLSSSVSDSPWESRVVPSWMTPPGGSRTSPSFW